MQRNARPEWCEIPTLELGGFANVMGEELSVGGYLGAGIFGGGGYLSVSSTGCKQ